MFDYKSVVSDAELTTVFIRDNDDPNIFNAFKKTEMHEYTKDDIIGCVLVKDGTFHTEDKDIFMQYKLWQTRPERKVGHKVSTVGKNIEQLIEEYEELFIGAYIMQKKWKVSKDGNPYEKALDWLRSTDFYNAPASTRYHDSFPGGLLLHSIKVYNQVVDLIAVPAFASVKIEEVTLVALMHDWCKIGFYEQYMKNVKDEKTGTWNKEPAYKVNQKGIPLGHGVTSMFLASKVINLTVDQALAIRWHMGHYNVSDKEENEFQKAVDEYTMVYLMQIADQLSCNGYTAESSEENKDE